MPEKNDRIVDTTGWSGEGAFTQLLIDTLRTIDGIAFLRVEGGCKKLGEAAFASMTGPDIFEFFAERTGDSDGDLVFETLACPIRKRQIIRVRTHGDGACWSRIKTQTNHENEAAPHNASMKSIDRAPGCQGRHRHCALL